VVVEEGALVEALEAGVAGDPAHALQGCGVGGGERGEAALGATEGPGEVPLGAGVELCCRVPGEGPGGRVSAESWLGDAEDGADGGEDLPKVGCRDGASWEQGAGDVAGGVG